MEDRSGLQDQTIRDIEKPDPYGVEGSQFHVAFGSSTSFEACARHFRFTPNTGPPWLSLG